MIRYALVCVGEHPFEAWFSNSEAYDRQRADGLVECPECGAVNVRKQIVAPAIRTSERRNRDAPGTRLREEAGEAGSMAPHPSPMSEQGDSTSASSEVLLASAQSVEARLARLAGEVRRHIASTYEYVGDDFADRARAMADGASEVRPVWGRASPEVARELMEEGAPVTPLPKPFAPDPPRRREKIN